VADTLSEPHDRKMSPEQQGTRHDHVRRKTTHRPKIKAVFWFLSGWNLIRDSADPVDSWWKFFAVLTGLFIGMPGQCL
jgi:hypothetical protein